MGRPIVAQRLNVLLAAGEAAGARALAQIVAADHIVVAVAAGSGADGGGDPVVDAARRLDVQLMQQAVVAEPWFARWAARQDIDLLLNVHSLTIVGAPLLEVPRIGCFNLHPGPLPRFAGLNTPSWAVYLGEREHAVTVHWMEPDVDTGPIAYESWFPIGDEDTGLTVSARCATLGLELLAQLLETAAANPSAIPARAQDLRERRYFGRRPPQNGNVEWSRPARDVVALVHASYFHPFPSPWGYPRAMVGEATIGVVRARLTGETCSQPPGTIGFRDDGDVFVATADEWIAVERVSLGADLVPAADVLALGDRLEDGRLDFP